MRYFASRDHAVTAVRWNTPKEGESPMDALQCNDSDLVHSVTLTEFNTILDIAGCLKTRPWWSWMVIGKISLNNGVLLVCPGDWIVEDHHGNIQVLSDEKFRKLYQADDASD